MNVENLFPVGTVVTVKGANKSMMIIGILPENKGTRFDYISVLYPEGYITAKEIYLFNHSDIERVEFLGFMNSEYQMFRNNLRVALSENAAEEE